MKYIDVMGEKLAVKMSHSFANNASCPLYLKLHYVDKVSERYVRVAAERGKGAHDAISSLIYQCREDEIQPQDLELDQISDAVMTHTPHCVMSEVGDILAWVKLWAERYRISKNYYGHEEKVGIDDEFDECEWSDASYRGILDVIDINGKYCTVTDWKSQPHILPPGELDAPLGYGPPEQLTFYCWLASKLYPQLEMFNARIWYLRYGFYDETKRTLEDLEMFEQALLIKEQKISEIDSWDPIPGRHCQYCDFIHMCPIGAEDGEDPPVIKLQEEAERAAERIHVMESRVSSLKDMLKDYVKQNDAVRFGDNRVFGINKKTSRTWSVVKVEEVFEQLAEREGFDDHKLSEVTNTDSRKMQKLLKQAKKDDPALFDALEDVEKPKHYTRFESYQQRVESE
jgi:hypothetical protein